jgi:hypothetical protein
MRTAVDIVEKLLAEAERITDESKQGSEYGPA